MEGLWKFNDKRKPNSDLKFCIEIFWIQGRNLPVPTVIIIISLFLCILEIIGAKEEQSSTTAWWCQSTKREHWQTKVTSNNISQTLSRWSWIRGFWHLHKHQAKAHYGSQRHRRSSHSLRGTNIGYRGCVIIENRQGAGYKF